MGGYVYTVACVALLVAVTAFLSPDGESGKTGKYIGFIGSLVVMVAILSPIPGLLSEAPGLSGKTEIETVEKSTEEEVCEYYARRISLTYCDIYKTDPSLVLVRVLCGDSGEVKAAELTVMGDISHSTQEAENILGSIFEINITIKEGAGG